MTRDMLRRLAIECGFCGVTIGEYPDHRVAVVVFGEAPEPMGPGGLSELRTLVEELRPAGIVITVDA